MTSPTTSPPRPSRAPGRGALGMTSPANITTPVRSRAPGQGALVMTRTAGGYAAGELTVHASPADIAAVTRALRAAGRRVALVPTMGALHEGHRELMRHARRMPGSTVTVVSIFVNPLQFGPNEDLARYPRPLEADLAACREEGVELVFTPGVADMYPAGADTVVTPGVLGTELEGAVRPGHFAGVLTVVVEALPHRRPGRRVLRREGLPAARPRPEDGARPGLLPLDRRRAHRPRGRRARAVVAQRLPLPRGARRGPSCCPRALRAGADVAARGAEAVLATARAVLAEEPEVAVDYLDAARPRPRPRAGDGARPGCSWPRASAPRG